MATSSSQSPAPSATAAGTASVSTIGTSFTVRTDCNGKGCSKAEVTVSLANSSWTQYADAQGVTKFANLSVGEGTVTVRDDTDPRHPVYGQARVKLVSAGSPTVSVRAEPLDANATISGVLVEGDGGVPARISGTMLEVEAICPRVQRRAKVTSPDGSFVVENLVADECSLSAKRFNDPPGRLDGNGRHTVTKVVAPATGVRLEVNDFVRRR